MSKVFLFIVTEIDSANGICSMAVMRQLVEDGNRVFCITGQKYGQDKEYETDGIKFFTVKPRLFTAIESYLACAQINPVFKKSIGVLNLLMNKVKLMLTVFTWPWISPLYTFRIYSKTKSVLNNTAVDCIVPVYKQIDPLIVAQKIKKQHKNICIVPYFLDSLSGGFGPKIFSEQYMIKRGKAWEKRVLSNADCVVVMASSKGHHNKYNTQSDFYEKLTYLDIPLLKLNMRENTDDLRDIKKDKKHITVLYAGTLHFPMRNVEYITDVISNVENPDIEFVFVGQSNVPHMFNKSDNMFYKGIVSHEEAVQMTSQADVLLNIGVTHSSAISGKIFEYMSFGKPIVSTFSVDDEACNPYLDKYPLSLRLDENNHNLKSQAKLLEEFILKNTGQSVDEQYIVETFKANTPNAMAELLQNLLNKINKEV